MTREANRRQFLSGEVFNTAPEPDEAPRKPPASGDSVRLETRAMACTWSVILNPGATEEVMTASSAFERVYELDRRLTIFRDDSELNQLNRMAASGEWHPMSAEVFGLLEQCAELYRRTDGCFDPVTRPLAALWRTCRQNGRVPRDEEIAQAKSWCGLEHVRFNRDELAISFELKGTGTPPLEIGFDLGAIGKGYAIDVVADELAKGGVDEYMVHGGYSSIRAQGGHNGADGWSVGIKNPLFNSKRLATLVLSNQALSTSGSNVQFFRHEGQRYGHIIDPRTGYPCDELLSVTVVAPTAAEADALSTAFYVMGLDNASSYCDDHPEIGAILVPIPQGTRTLAPVVRNIPETHLFFEP
ncbi:MAG: FAD:protein FMN transferase [Planctomycetaceae bacterium]|nr:FAD:protein FMN transferase [Planctomycetaceae bacterium]